ncbi:MAG: DUF4404 family protein [Verrucomicrobia bacterium]|jgi:hypothetical protein|nr:DUF4404 family protein [Verrucomicrobiota bacterium]
MIEDTIAKIEKQLRASQTIRPERRAELLKLLETLKTEVSSIASSHREEADSIARFTEVSTHEATRSSQDQQLLDLSLEGLRSSARSFEESHPKLVQIVNSISRTLSNLGI